MSESFIQTVERISDKLYHFIYRLTGNRDDALDLTQETFVKLFDLNRKNNTELKDSYFYKTAFNMALNIKRNSLNRKSKEQEIQDLSSDNSKINIQDEIEKSEESFQIRSALAQLSDRQREVITYRFFSEMTLEEIAKLLSISTGSVKVHLARGLQNIKKYLYINERI